MPRSAPRNAAFKKIHDCHDGLPRAMPISGSRSRKTTYRQLHDGAAAQEDALIFAIRLQGEGPLHGALFIFSRRPAAAARRRRLSADRRIGWRGSRSSIGWRSRPCGALSVQCDAREGDGDSDHDDLQDDEGHGTAIDLRGRDAGDPSAGDLVDIGLHRRHRAHVEQRKAEGRRAGSWSAGSRRDARRTRRDRCRALPRPAPAAARR